jgi:hypothetical protein
MMVASSLCILLSSPTLSYNELSLELSSEDEMEGEGEEEKGMISFNRSLDLCIGQIGSTSGPLSSPQDKPPHIAVATVAPSSDSVSDEHKIDWEDTDEDESVEEDEEDSKPAAAPLWPITITMDQSKDRRANNSCKKKKRKRGRNVYQNASLSADLGQLLKDLYKVHLPALMIRAVLLSRACSIRNILHLAHSLVPLRFETETQLPTLEQIRILVCLWYFDFVNCVDQRRQARLWANVAVGAPCKGRQQRNSSDVKNTNQYYTHPLKTLTHGDVTPLALMQLCSCLSTLNDENPQVHTGTPHIANNDKVQLLIALIRSLGWRARYVVALDPVRQDLDVEHPILVMGAVANVFEAVYKKSKQGKIVDADKWMPNINHIMFSLVFSLMPAA